MQEQVVGRLKKWMIFALIGCFAYFAGYIWGQRQSPEPQELTPASQKVKETSEKTQQEVK